jgi:hypothetical protein
MQAVNTSAEPSQVARASLPRSIQRPTGRNGKAGGDDAEPDDGKAEFDGPVGRGDADDEDQRLDERDVS